MTQKKKIIIAIISCACALIIATVVTLISTVWNPKFNKGNNSNSNNNQNNNENNNEKSLQEWLNDFSTSLIIENDYAEQKIEKIISITEDDEKVAQYYQLLEVKFQNEENIAHFIVLEEYPTLETQEFDINDEYYFIDDTMYMQRTVMEETFVTSFGATREAFWEVVNENLGGVSYNFAESNFDNIKITHTEKVHNFTASVSEEHKSGFFANTENLSDISNTEISMSIDDTFQLIEFKITYIYKEKQLVEICVSKSEPTEIEIKDFARK